MAEQVFYFTFCVFIGFMLGFHGYRMHAARRRLRQQAVPVRHATSVVGKVPLKPRTRPMAVRKEPRHG